MIKNGQVYQYYKHLYIIIELDLEGYHSRCCMVKWLDDGEITARACKAIEEDELL
jgi:hypothetical protein